MLEGVAPRLAAATRLPRPALTAAGLQQLTASLLGAALLETLLLRQVTRIGVHLPKEGAITRAFEGASIFSSLAFNFASLLAIGLAVVVLASLARRMESWPARLALAGLSVAMLSGLAVSLITNSATADAVFGVASALLVGVIGLVFAREANRTFSSRLALALMVVAYFSYQYYVLSHLFYRILDYGAVPPMSISVLRLGEVLAVAAAAAAFRAWGLPRWRWVGSGGLAVVAAVLLVLIFAGLSPYSTMAILALWTTGLSLILPLPRLSPGPGAVPAHAGGLLAQRRRLLDGRGTAPGPARRVHAGGHLPAPAAAPGRGVPQPRRPLDGASASPGRIALG